MEDLFANLGEHVTFFKKVAHFDAFGTQTRVEHKQICGESIPYYINEFWTAKQRAGHSLHEVSYRACFKPQLPRFFIERLTKPQDMVYDPFMGRGTTLMEAALMGRNVVGNDVNPLSRFLCQPRLYPPRMEEVTERLSSIDWNKPMAIEQGERDDLEPFYHPETLTQLLSLRGAFLAEEQGNHVDAWIRMVATNRLTGHSPGFFSVYTLPPNQAVIPKRQRIINEKRQQIPEAKNVAAIITKKSKALLSKLSEQERAGLAAVRSTFLTGQADAAEGIASESVDLVVTSPPFLDVIDYRTDNWLRCWFNGFDSMSLPISQLRKPKDWVEKMSDVFLELKRVLKKGGWIAFEVGEVGKGKLLLEELVVEAAMSAGLRAHGVLINDQEFTKTANCWGVGNQNKGTNTNRIVMLTK